MNNDSPIIKSRVLDTIQKLQEEYKDQWTDWSPPVAFSVRDVAGVVFRNDFVMEIPSPLLTLLVFNEMKDLVEKGFLEKIKDPSQYAHYTRGPKAEYFILIQ